MVVKGEVRAGKGGAGAEGRWGRYDRVGEKSPKKHSIQEVIDAVSGATWNTRNRIMEDLFKEELAASDGDMPTFAPPGSSLENERGE